MTRFATQLPKPPSSVRMQPSHTLAGAHLQRAAGNRATDEWLERGENNHDGAALVRRVLGDPGQPLDSSARAALQPRFAHDLSRIRVHTDSLASESAGEIGAAAWTFGRHIAFAPGRFAPLTAAGQRLLLHEIAHTAQDAVGAGKALHGDLVIDAPDSPAERAARSAAASGPLPIPLTTSPRVLHRQVAEDVARESGPGADARQKTGTPLRPGGKRSGGGVAVVLLATITVKPGDTYVSMMMRALVATYGSQGMTPAEATYFALKALSDWSRRGLPVPTKRVKWKAGKKIQVNLSYKNKQWLDRKYFMRTQGAEIEQHGTEPEGDVGGGDALDGATGLEGAGEPAEDVRRGTGSPEGTEGGTGELGDEGVLEGGVTREKGGAKGGRVGATGVEGGRRGGEGKSGDEGVRGALAWFPLIKVSEFWASLVEVALILADAGAFDSAFSKLMKVATRAVRSQLRASARSFGKTGIKDLARLLKQANLPRHEVRYVLELTEAQRRVRYYEEIANRAASEHKKLAGWVEEGSVNRETLTNLTKQRDQAARIEREARKLQLKEIDEVNSLKERDVTTGDPELDEQIAAALDDADSPAVQGGKRPTMEGRSVTKKRGDRLDIKDIRLRPGEMPLDAVQRVRRVIGQPLSDTPLAKAWNEAREEVLQNRSINSIGKTEMNKTGGTYEQVRNLFWKKVRGDRAAKRFLARAGFELGETPAPLLRVSREGVPVQQRRVSLDHKLEKAIGQNWRKAIDADNFVLEFHDPNAFREIVQRRHKMRLKK